MSEAPAPLRHVTFDWRIYAEATCAGLTALIPIPFLDLAFERTFRRRMPTRIARVRGRQLAPGAKTRFGRGLGHLISVEGCLAVPLALGRYLVKKLWRKIVYVFAVADAASLVSAYWHRAYLLDHVIRAGHAAPEVDWPRSVAVFEAVLADTDTSPLVGLARQTVAGVHRTLRLLIVARREGAAEETESLSRILRSHWDAAERSLVAVAVRYNEVYSRSLETDPPGGVVIRGRNPR